MRWVIILPHSCLEISDSNVEAFVFKGLFQHPYDSFTTKQQLTILNIPRRPSTTKTKDDAFAETSELARKQQPAASSCSTCTYVPRVPLEYLYGTVDDTQARISPTTQDRPGRLFHIMCRIAT